MLVLPHSSKERRQELRVSAGPPSSLCSPTPVFPPGLTSRAFSRMLVRLLQNTPVPRPWNQTLVPSDPVDFNCTLSRQKQLETVWNHLRMGRCCDDGEKASWKVHWMPILHQLLSRKLYSLTHPAIHGQTLHSSLWVIVILCLQPAESKHLLSPPERAMGKKIKLWRNDHCLQDPHSSVRQAVF